MVSLPTRSPPKEQLVITDADRVAIRRTATSRHCSTWLRLPVLFDVADAQIVTQEARHRYT
jgi:hypothetical protein